MAIENFVSNDFLSKFVDSIDVFDCRLPGVIAPFSGDGILLTQQATRLDHYGSDQL